MGANTMANIRLLAPEIIKENPAEETISEPTDGLFSKSYSPAIDIYAFGIVALEMAVLGIKNNPNCTGKASQFNYSHPAHPYGGRYSEGSIQATPNYYGELSGPFVSRESIRKALDLLDNDLQKDFINRCLNEDPTKRPTAKELLFHPIIFEVPCLKVICANKILNNSSTGYSLEQIEEEFNKKMQNTQGIIAEIHRLNGTNEVRRICDLSKLNTEYLEKFFEEVRNGVYPLYAFSAIKTKISKYMKMKRNSTFKNLVENAMSLNATKEPTNGCGERDGAGKQPEHNETAEATGESGHLRVEPNDTAELSRTDDPEYEEDEYDQEEETGSQNEDYEGRCENCSNDSYEEETRRIEHIEITLSSLTTGQVRIKNDKLFCLDLLLKLDDKMNRKLSCSLSSQCDNGMVLSNELVANGFINSVGLRSSDFLFLNVSNSTLKCSLFSLAITQKDRDLVEEKIDEAINKQNDFTELASNQSIACCYTNAS